MGGALCARFFNQPPEGERLAGTDQDSVNARRGKREIDRLVVLQNRVDLAERAADERIMPANQRGQRRALAHCGKALTGDSVAQRAQRAVFSNRNTVGERRQLTEKLSMYGTLTHCLSNAR